MMTGPSVGRWTLAQEGGRDAAAVASLSGTTTPGKTAEKSEKLVPAYGPVRILRHQRERPAEIPAGIAHDDVICERTFRHRKLF